MRIAELLAELEQINRDDIEAAAEFGPLEMGQRGIEVRELLCVDRRTRFAPSPQIREFYAYAAWWRHCSVQLEWREPCATEAWISRDPVRDMIAADTTPGALTAGGLSPSSIALFALDDPGAPFERAYFVFGDREEPQVLYAGSEVSVFDDLAGYLESWVESLS